MIGMLEENKMENEQEGQKPWQQLNVRRVTVCILGTDDILDVCQQNIKSLGCFNENPFMWFLKCSRKSFHQVKLSLSIEVGHNC